jgi:hypothetical protein
LVNDRRTATAGPRWLPQPLTSIRVARWRLPARRELWFVARLREARRWRLCAEFGISRKTGYKSFDRYKDCCVQAFSDRSHRARRPVDGRAALIDLASRRAQIIDDLGMRKLRHTAAEDLLEVIMRRYERASTLLTSNRPVDDWASCAATQLQSPRCLIGCS